MDHGNSSKIRALTLASRCLSREIRRLKDSPGLLVHDAAAVVEIDRLVSLARTILDPGAAKKEAKGGRRSESEELPPAPLPKASAGDPDDAILDLADDGPPSTSHVLVLFGRGTLVPIPELVGFLGTLGVKGILRVETKREQFVVEFHDGQISHAEGTRGRRGQRLGDLLVTQGAIERPVLEEVLTREPGWRLGCKLVEEELITKAQLVRALQAQIQLLFCRLFREEARSYTFWSGPSIWGEQGVRLNSTSLLLESARVADEVGDDLHALDGTNSSDDT